MTTCSQNPGLVNQFSASPRGQLNRTSPIANSSESRQKSRDIPPKSSAFSKRALHSNVPSNLVPRTFLKHFQGERGCPWYGPSAPLGGTSQQEPYHTNMPSGLVASTLLWTYFWALMAHRGGTNLVRYLCETRKALRERHVWKPWKVKVFRAWVSRDIPNFLAPTPSRGRPPPHPKISGPKSLGLGSFSCLRIWRKHTEVLRGLHLVGLSAIGKGVFGHF